VVAFTVDREYLKSPELLGLPVVAFEEVGDRYPPEGHRMFVALSYARMNQARAETVARCRDRGYELASYVSSRCSFLTDHTVGANCFILEDNTVQPFVRIGENVTLWSGNHIGHDSVIEDHCFVTSHVVISGNCLVESHCFLGVNATIGNSVRIARRTLVGAGAVITKDTVEGGVYVPPRAILLEKRSDQLSR
jgi:sugar O-acyltransferase (sialic acid O-acetyltransferase NeuD family)